MKRYTTITICLAAAATCAAQGLHTEITVDRTVQPELQGVSRPKGVTPSLLPIQIGDRRLTAAEYTAPSALTPQISVLPPVEVTDTLQPTPYRGYAMIGYLPMYNMDASAGYRILDTRTYGLGAWIQYNGNSYHGDLPYYNDALMTNHTLTVGANGHYRINRMSMLSASGKASLISVRHPYYYTENDNRHWRSYDQGAKSLHGQLQWDSRYGSLVYAIRGAADYFSMNMNIPADLREINTTARQAAVHAGASVGLAYDGTLAAPMIGVDGDISVIRSSNTPHTSPTGFTVYNTVDYTQTSIRPYIRLENSVVKSRVGLNVAIGTGGSAKTTIAPDAEVTWTPLQPIAMYTRLSGGQKFNYLSEVFDLNPYMTPYRSYGRSTMPLIIDAGINIGPYDGMSLSIYGGYAQVRDYLTPLVTINRNGYMASSFFTSDYDSWYIGANIGYAYKRLFDVSFGVRAGGSDSDYRSWYEWMDAPKVVADARVGIAPMERLHIDLSYQMRYDRKARSVVYPPDEPTYVKYVGIPNLGTVNSVNVGATYQIYPWLTGFMSIENLLAVKTQLISGMPDQGIRGLMGVSCKF